ncbi:MAG TPA: hypothetical protein VMB49_01015 [Acidobacteriaceae bacterium]|nr:hypothetical protein [Acidobacteriaceae bacterium]
MKKFAIAMVLCLSAASGLAQCSTNRISARKEAHMSSAVVVATVTAATPVPEAWDFLDGVNYTVHIDTKIHGKARRNTELTVFSENSPRFFAMYVGQQYVLYLQPMYGRYQVDNCGNSHATDEIETAKESKQIAARGF